MGYTVDYSNQYVVAFLGKARVEGDKDKAWASRIIGWVEADDGAVPVVLVLGQARRADRVQQYLLPSHTVEWRITSAEPMPGWSPWVQRAKTAPWTGSTEEPWPDPARPGTVH